MTVQGESIDYVGDVDEFTFPATRSDEHAFLQTPVGFPGGPAVLEVVEPGTGTMLGSAESSARAPISVGSPTARSYSLSGRPRRRRPPIACVDLAD